MVIESAKTVILTVTSGTGYTIGSPASGTVNIADNEPVLSVTVPDAEATESGAAPTNSGMIRINLTSAPTLTPLIVRFTQSGSSAQHPGDYTMVIMNPDGSEGATLGGAPVSIPVGRSHLDIRIKPVDDTIREGVESAKITFMTSSTYRYTLGANTVAIVNITSNE
jgi:hypothetical protein